MKSYIKGVTDISKALIKTFNKACDVALDPNHTQADIDQVWRDFEKACHDAGYTSTDAAREEMKGHLIQQLQNGGMSKAQAEAWGEQKWKDVMDLGDRVREAVPKAEKAWRFMSLKVLGAIVVLGGVLSVIPGLHHSETQDEKMYRVTQLLNEMDASNKALQALETTEDQFNIMTGGLEVGGAEPSEPLPTAVAAVAEQPVEVEVTRPSGTHSFTSTIGQVYRNAPQEAQHRIEHDYDHPTVYHHKDITVTSPVGSVRITVPKN